MPRQSLEPFECKCSWCEQVFVSNNSAQLGALGQGKKVYCSKRCASAQCRKNSKSRHLCGPCKECGKMYRSHIRTKTYCTLECYQKSEELQDRLKSNNDAKRKPPQACPNCGKTFQHKKNKYCSSDCRRQYFADRFDRFIANPEKLALPQNFDEFLIQETLPCLVEGCEWVGEHLASHVNKVHGITADKFKELAGFNRSTGLVGANLRKYLSQRMKDWIADGTVVSDPETLPKGRTSQPPLRLEAKEHLKKSRAIMRARESARPDRKCRQCDKMVPQPVIGRRLYCSTMCRSRYYREATTADLLCEYCGEQFTGLKDQVKRAQQGLPVCCSINCRNRLNMTTCLEKTGSKSPSSKGSSKKRTDIQQ
jgi:hypothetical protein